MNEDGAENRPTVFFVNIKFYSCDLEMLTVKYPNLFVNVISRL